MFPQRITTNGIPSPKWKQNTSRKFWHIPTATNKPPLDCSILTAKLSLESSSALKRWHKTGLSVILCFTKDFYKDYFNYYYRLSKFNGLNFNWHSHHKYTKVAEKYLINGNICAAKFPLKDLTFLIFRVFSVNYLFRKIKSGYFVINNWKTIYILYICCLTVT